MSIGTTEPSAQKPDIPFGSPEWVSLRAGTTEDCGANDPHQVEEAVESVRRHASETAEGNGQKDVDVEQPTSTVQHVIALIEKRMHALRPGPKPKYREVDRHREMQSIIGLAEKGVSPKEMILALRQSNHKGTRSFGNNTFSVKMDEPVTDKPVTTAEFIRGMVERSDTLLELLDPDDEARPSTGDSSADRAFAQAEDHLFVAPNPQDDSPVPEHDAHVA